MGLPAGFTNSKCWYDWKALFWVLMCLGLNAWITLWQVFHNSFPRPYSVNITWICSEDPPGWLWKLLIIFHVFIEVNSQAWGQVLCLQQSYTKKLLFIIPWLNSQFNRTVTLRCLAKSQPKRGWKGMSLKQLRKPSCSLGSGDWTPHWLIDWLTIVWYMKTWLSPCFPVELWRIIQFALLMVTVFECPWSAFLCDKEIYWLASWQKSHLNYSWQGPAEEKLINRCIYGSHPTWDMLQLLPQ